MNETEMEFPVVPDDDTTDVAHEILPLTKGQDAIVYPLAYPRKLDGKPLRKVTLRRPTQGDLDDLASGVIETNRDLLCHLTGLHRSVIRGLDARDSEALHGMLIDMMPAYLREN